MNYSVDFLLKNSNLPGPRANLELLYQFSQSASESQITTCLSYSKEDLKNSPEEFVVMCGIVAHCIKKGHLFIDLHSNSEALIYFNAFLKPFANHNSWRIREAVAIGLQEIAKKIDIFNMLHFVEPWCNGSYYEQRALVATLCEPALLKNETANLVVFDYLLSVTLPFNQLTGKLSDSQKSLRKALAYGWSVVIVASPNSGKRHLEALIHLDNKHIHWIVKENLKKNRLIKMDSEWVNDMILKS